MSKGRYRCQVRGWIPDPDPGDGTNPFRIPDPGFKKAPDPGAVLSLTVDKVIQSSLFQAPGRAGTGQQQLLSEV